MGTQLFRTAPETLAAMFAKVVLVGCFAVFVCAEHLHVERTYEPPSQTYHEPEPAYSHSQPSYHQSHEAEEGKPFNYFWKVHDDYSNNHYSHDSKSDGKLTEGQYKVLLPDGRTQVVTYTADGYQGFKTEVTYEGEARTYEHQPSYKPEPSYKPKPSYKPEPSYKHEPSYKPEPSYY